MTESKVHRILPTALAGSLCCALTAYLSYSIRARTGGIFVYPLDDSYIHLALARTFAFDHVWGIGPYGFASASSSPGWTLVLAASDLLIGSHLGTPVLLNLLLVFLILLAVDAAFWTFTPQCPVWLRYTAPIVIVLGTPLASLALLGMEHVAQTLSVLLLLISSVWILAAPPSERIPTYRSIALLASGLFAGAVRYEAVFAVLPVFVLLLLRRRSPLAFLLAASAAFGPLAFAVFSYLHSGYVLPFSVMAKMSQSVGMRGPLRDLASMFIGKRENTPFVAVLLLVWIYRLRRRGLWEPVQLFLLLTVVLTCEHLLLAPVGWLMRYEGYLVCLSLLGLALVLAELRLPSGHQDILALPSWRLALLGAIAFLSLVSAWSLGRRSLLGRSLTIQAAVDRYDEHIQVARFVAANYDNSTIVLDDIGAVAFYSHAHLLDMTGLGSVEPFLPLRVGRRFNSEDMRQWADSSQASIAIIQEEPATIRNLTPGSWTLVQIWKQPRNVVFNDLTTSIYAVQPAELARLCRDLAKFSLAQDDQIVFNVYPAWQGK